MLMTDVQKYVPSAFATNPKPGVTERYEFLPTSNILNYLTDNGYEIRHVTQRKSRKVENRPYAKHMITFRKSGYDKQGDIVPEGILINSHDKTTALEFRMGFFRVVCTNGLVVGTSVFPGLSFKHNHNNPIELVLDQLDNKWKMFDDIVPAINEMRNFPLTTMEQYQFAHRVNYKFYNNSLVDPLVDLLKVRREEDTSSDIWTIYNRIQENMMKGGLHVPNIINGTKRQARSPVRGTKVVRNIDRLVEWNADLWDLTTEFMGELQ